MKSNVKRQSQLEILLPFLDRNLTLINFLAQNKQQGMNTFFHKYSPPKQTWIRLNGYTKNEIDHILTNCRKIDKHVSRKVRLTFKYYIAKKKENIGMNLKKNFRIQKLIEKEEDLNKLNKKYPATSLVETSQKTLLCRKQWIEKRKTMVKQGQYKAQEYRQVKKTQC